MTAGGTGNRSVGRLAPAAALAALALGIVALVAPMPFLNPPAASNDGDSIIPAPVSKTRPGPTAIVPEDWSELAPRLAMLRNTPTQVEIAAAQQPTDTQPAAVTYQTPTSGPARQPLRWRYLGWIQEPDRMAALVLMNDANQRFFYPGQEVVDEMNSDSAPIRIVSINENELVISRAGAEERIVRTIGETTAPSMFPNPPSPQPRGVRTPQRPSPPRSARPAGSR